LVIDFGLSNEQAANRIIDEVKVLNQEAKLNFIKCDTSLLKNVATACQAIRSEETRVNLLVLTSGALSLNGRDGNFSSPT
jgi:hypothetical protein